ncbi:MAG: hypothetical protein Q9225_000811 [Loekoesia sp. 1 TL-2023]
MSADNLFECGKPPTPSLNCPQRSSTDAVINSDRSNIENDIEMGPRRIAPADTGFVGHSTLIQASPNIVDWDGQEDPANPQNWPKVVRLGHVAVVSIMTLIANLASTMFAPGAALLMKDFHQTNSTVATLTVTIYLLGFALGPLAIAPLSELYGRLAVYHTCNAVFLAFTIGCALSTDVGMFLVFRFITGCAGSAPLTNGGGTVADVMPQDKRGAAMAIFAVGPLLGPVIGPIMGGFISQDSGVVAVFALIFMRETYAPLLLKRKATKLSKVLGNPSLKARDDAKLSPAALFARAIVRPLKMLALSPIVLSLSLFCALVFGLTFLLFTTFPAVFEEQYGFTSGLSGLSYLGLGIGMIFGLGMFSVLSDEMLKARAGKGEMKPEYRLPLMVYLTPVMPIGFFWYGWSAHERAHWIVPILGTLIIGLGSLFVIMPAQIYLVDAFGPYAASALAANTVLRSLFGTFLPLAGPHMYSSLGLGWGNTLLGFLSLAFAPLPWLFYHYGERLRKRWEVNW